MAKSKNNLFGAPPKVRVSQKTSVSAPTGSNAGPRDTTAKALGVSSLSKVSAINFGSFRAKTSTTSSSSSWTNLLEQATSGGIASALGGGLSTITGLGGLVYGILNLFGGSSAPAAPVQFTLPASQQTTVSLRPQTVATSVSSPGGDSGSGAGAGSTTATLSVAYQPSAPASGHSQVVQAVKQALLTSSSLNDVIAEV